MAAKTFAEIMKFNPYHDAKGRFASANSATSFTIRTKDPSKQHMADRAREREKERDAAGGASDTKEETPRMKAIHDIEDRIRNQNYESAAVVDKDGNVVIDKEGGRSQVGFTPMECMMMRNNTLTHNHPGSSMFSTEDTVCFVKNNLEEIRATTRQGVTFSLKRGQDYDTEKDGLRFVKDYDGERMKAHRIAQAELDSRGYREMIMSGEITQDFANREFGKVVTREMVSFCDSKASSYNIDFTVEERKVSKKYDEQTYTGKSAGDDDIVMVLDQETEDLDAAAFAEWLNGPVSKNYDVIVEVEKFNPYHDRLGRFTSAGSETSFTYAPGKSKAHDKAIERHKERMASAAPTEAQAKTLKGIESRTRNLKKEQFRVVDREGNVVMQKQGDKNSVSYSVGEARDNFPGNITIHNHPDGGTFSSADLSDIGYGATEIRAASPEGTYILRNLSHGTKWTADQKGWFEMRDDIDAASQTFKSDRQLKKELRAPYEQKVKPISDKWAKMRAEGASQEELNKVAKEYTDTWDSLKPQLEKDVRKAYVDQYHHWYKANAGKYGFEYSFTPTRGTTQKSMDEIDEIEKSTGEIVLDRKMREDVEEIVNDILSEYPRYLNQTTEKSAPRSILFIGLPIRHASNLAIEGGEDPKDFHVTLAYGYFDPNGNDEDSIDVRVQRSIDYIRDAIPDTIHFDAIGRFSASESSDGKDVIYAQVAAGQLEEAHDGLLNALKKHGIKLETTFPEYKPHMTLAYIDPDREYKLEKIDAKGTVNSILIGHGEESSHENQYTIAKMDEDKRLVFGWASVSITVDGEQLEDRQKDIIDPEDLEEAAYEYVLNFRDTGEEHIQTMRKKGKLVESCVFTAEKQKAMGIPEGILPVGWWIGFKIEDDAAWEKVKNGTYKMFSIEGRANREPVGKSYDEIEEVEKFNPYHDAKGRFASANGYASFTVRTKDPSKQHMANAAIAREKERAAAAGAKDDGKKRVKEAEKKIATMLADGAKVNLDGMDPEMADSVAKSIESVLTKYPGVKDAFGGFTTEDTDKHTFADRDGVMGAYVPSTKMIHLNNSYYGNKAEFDKRYAASVERQHSPQGTTADSVVVHEMGHAIDMFVSLKVIGEQKVYWAGDKVSTRLWNNDIKAGKRKGEPVTGKSLREGLSRYAGTNAAEYLAEGFAEFMTSPNPRPMAASIGKRLETYIKKADKAG